jgi:hypothetical protein
VVAAAMAYCVTIQIKSTFLDFILELLLFYPAANLHVHVNGEGKIKKSSQGKDLI